MLFKSRWTRRFLTSPHRPRLWARPGRVSRLSRPSSEPADLDQRRRRLAGGRGLERGIDQTAGSAGAAAARRPVALDREPVDASDSEALPVRQSQGGGPQGPPLVSISAALCFEQPRFFCAKPPGKSEESFAGCRLFAPVNQPVTLAETRRGGPLACAGVIRALLLRTRWHANYSRWRIRYRGEQMAGGDQLERLWASLIGLGPRRLAALGAVGVAIFAFVGFGSYYLSRPTSKSSILAFPRRTWPASAPCCTNRASPSMQMPRARRCL